MKRLVSEISCFLGEPEPYEIERKFLIEHPDIALLEKQPNCQKVEIIQTYLRSDENEEIRIRQRGAQGSYIYFKTVKKYVTPTTRVELEERLSEKEYLKLLMEADTSMHQIRKTRYCLSENGNILRSTFILFGRIRPLWRSNCFRKSKRSNCPAFCTSSKK